MANSVVVYVPTGTYLDIGASSWKWRYYLKSLYWPLVAGFILSLLACFYLWRWDCESRNFIFLFRSIRVFDFQALCHVRWIMVKGCATVIIAGLPLFIILYHSPYAPRTKTVRAPVGQQYELVRPISHEGLDVVQSTRLAVVPKYTGFLPWGLQEVDLTLVNQLTHRFMWSSSLDMNIMGDWLRSQYGLEANVDRPMLLYRSVKLAYDSLCCMQRNLN